MSQIETVVLKFEIDVEKLNRSHLVGTSAVMEDADYEVVDVTVKAPNALRAAVKAERAVAEDRRIPIDTVNADSAKHHDDGTYTVTVEIATDHLYFDPACIIADIDATLRDHLFGDALDEDGASVWTGEELHGAARKMFRKPDKLKGALEFLTRGLYVKGAK